ncbi:MAG: DNA mismatch repair protein MutS [Desulfofustis sp. PB-SRB1]|jgi:DNA mismatch repair protein MutS|nr:DNA mismatch repair protein MutS [Desulfofustis sp. PB-SRB1]MBM1001322.1 DNA mismatch repair protein MutS [Desulfofustis sp. PB-SRB1]HBH28933.1 DNA mismatch repair protein MutS [Desulfofustis sp.]HBH30388.1 DNA mismatch repair protein MutS [Desulfofustis sp.]
MSTSLKMTPMLRQFLEIKERHSDDILFYRMGDFYEMFFEDAEVAAPILNIALTSRSSKTDSVKVPMCGVPYHAAQQYIAKLVQAGKRVAICEQVEDPAQAKGIVKREVTRIITPGVVLDEQLLDDSENRFVAAVSCDEAAATVYGVAFLDLSTGALLVSEYHESGHAVDELLDHLCRLAPAELLIAADHGEKMEVLQQRLPVHLPELCITPRDDVPAGAGLARRVVCEHFGVLNLAGYGCDQLSQAIIAAALLLDYAGQTQKSAIDHIQPPKRIENDRLLQIDETSHRNLELTRTIVGNSRQGSLLATIDKTGTPMGARLLKQFLLFPPQDVHLITERLEAVDYLYRHSDARDQLSELLNKISDLERLNSRMMVGQGNGRDGLALKHSLAQLPAIQELIGGFAGELFTRLSADFDPLADITELLAESLADDPPFGLREGNLIKAGYNEHLDELVAIIRDQKTLIFNLEEQERHSTGIAKLKVGYNKVFGYFIEVSNAHLDKVPEQYIRKQTLVGGERFITPELKNFEEKVLHAHEQRLELEYQLFVDIRTRLATHSKRIINTAQLIALLDVCCCLAEVGRRHRYCKPEIDEDGTIEIIEGRHPVIEQNMAAGTFVPNDVTLNQTDNQMLIITGPNMAGKSTILRQTALIVILAHMGSFVPATQARITLVDRIFTRVGAMDDLRRGQSTFMVEMSETANILHNATSRSLVILDEIGRGTSTYDGLAIAWAVAEALINTDAAGVKTLFATHYHELTELGRTHPRIQNYSVSVNEWNKTIIFLHKLVKGGANRSYGIQVAALAGVPAPVVSHAERILSRIERGNQLSPTGRDKASLEPKRSPTPRRPSQLSLLPPTSHPAIERLRSINPDELTPRQALDILFDLRDLSRQEQ